MSESTGRPRRAFVSAAEAHLRLINVVPHVLWSISRICLLDAYSIGRISDHSVNSVTVQHPCMIIVRLSRFPAQKPMFPLPEALGMPKSARVPSCQLP